MTRIDYHGALEELGVACNMAQTDICFIRNPLVGISFRSLSREALLGRILWKTGVFLRHLVLLWRIWLRARYRVILLREFSSWPLLIVIPLLLPLRRKLVFTVNHNLQWAMRSKVERFAFRMIERLGFRFLFFELQDQSASQRLGMRPDFHWRIPHPVAERKHSANRCRVFTVGMVGHYRPEKGIDDALSMLLEKQVPYRVLVGVPNMEEFMKLSRFGKKLHGFELRDTSDLMDYYAALAECDVVLLSYTSDGYRFRASGLVADAAACGAAVLVPNFPTIRHQAEFPVPIGRCYGTMAEVPSLLNDMSSRIDVYKNAIMEYVAHRSGAALSETLEGLVVR